jgi:membrane associated rhomboid family serine protease
MQHNFLFALKLLGILWAVQILNKIMDYRLNILGISPRKVRGLPGILFSPFLHGNFTHLFFNSIPFFMLTDLLLTEGKPIFYSVSIEVIVLSGILVWLFGKRGIHIGVSSLIMGYFGYLLGKAYFQFNATTIIVAGLCLYYFGGLFLALFPSVKKNISWEGHVFGFLSGIFAAFANKTILWFVGF